MFLPGSSNIILSAALIKNLAKETGFDACGLAASEDLPEDRKNLEQWLVSGNHGNMAYLARNVDKRTNPQLLVPGSKTVVALLLNYYTNSTQPAESPEIARYAYSDVDYHQVIRAKTTELERKIIEVYGENSVNPEFQHSFVDSAPILERRWAQKAGLGWIGKNTLLIHPGLGSFVFIAILVLQHPADAYDHPLPERCGKCTKCIDICPTEAIKPNYLEARRCISYLTIENKEAISSEFKSKLGKKIIGCDSCQTVCPWNKKWATPHQHPELEPNSFLLIASLSDWKNLDKTKFNQYFKNSAIKRAGFDKLASNLEFINL